MRAHEAVLVVLAAGGLATCGGPGERENGATGAPALTVAVVNYPLAYFAERIGGPDAEVIFPAPGGVDPAHWSPDPETIAAYQAANLVILNGADYAKWVAQASLPTTRVVDTGAAYADRLIPLEDAVTHAHGPEGEHAHGGLAFTTWLDPSLAVEQSRAIAAAFTKTRPSKAGAFNERLVLLVADLDALGQRLESVAAAIGDQPLVFSHPVYQYLQRRFGLNGRSVHWEPDAEPTEAQWRELEHLLDEHPARWMIWEGEPLAPVTAALETRGLGSLVFEPCANVPAEGNYLSVMHSNLDRLESSWAPALP